MDKAQFVDFKLIKTPLAFGMTLSKTSGQPFEDGNRYRFIVRALQYCKLTRLELHFSMNNLCQFLHCPIDVHFCFAKKVLRYLGGTISHHITFHKSTSLSLGAYCDTDWAACLDDK